MTIEQDERKWIVKLSFDSKQCPHLFFMNKYASLVAQWREMAKAWRKMAEEQSAFEHAGVHDPRMTDKADALDRCADQLDELVELPDKSKID